MTDETRHRLIVALDFDRLDQAFDIARELVDITGIFKIGSQLFTSEGPKAVERIASLGAGVFLDLKFHDIPNTVAGSIRAAAKLPSVRMITLHTLGGAGMLRAAAQALATSGGARGRRPMLLGITLLTSLDAAGLRRVGISGRPAARAVHLARLAKQASLDGVVTSAHEVRSTRRACGKGFLIVVPGVRLRAHGSPKTLSTANDQARVATPAEAIRAGADWVVVGRPITRDRDPRRAALTIVAEISRALPAQV